MAQSRNNALVLLAVLTLTALGLVAWLALDDGPAPLNVAGPLAKDAPRAAQAPAQLVEPARATQTENSAVATPSPSAPERVVVDAAAERELAEALWVEGRVVWPEGTPLDEELQVVADGKEFEHLGEPKGKHRVRVDSDGRFRVAFRKDTKAGSLTIDARYCYLETPLKLKPASPPANIVLEPMLGGCITGMVKPPAGASDLEAVRGKVGVTSFGWGIERAVQQRSAKLDANWRYELRGLSVDREHRVNFDAQVWTPFVQDSVRVAAGKATTVDIACELGVTLRGVVVDAAGEPLGNTAIAAQLSESNAKPRWDASRRMQANAQGEFHLQGAPAGALKLEFTRDGYLDKTLELGELADGATREGLRVVLDSGGFVAGVVTWDDGSPAERAMVQVEEPREATRVFFGEPKGHRVDADGRFRITGLGAGPFKVIATAPEASRPRPEGVEAPKSKLSGPKWRAEARDVTAGAELALVLGPGESVAGIVLDESGAPVTKFSIRTVKRSNGMVFGGADAGPTRKFDSDDGRFVLEGLGDGAWSLIADAKGYTSSDPLSVDTPYSGPELTIRLARASRLAGIVVDPTGKPLAEASVEVEREQKIRRVGPEHSMRRSDDQGRFELKDAPNGLVKLRATHPKFAASQWLELRVAPGEEREDLRLELSEGGTIRGSIHASELRSDVTWSVTITSKEGGDWNQTTADAAGAFELQRVRPGEHRISAHSRGGSPSEDKGKSLLMLHTTVTVEAGRTVEVVLGAPSAQALELRGRVTIGGEAAAGARLFVSRSGFFRQAESGADGTYSLMVDGPGRYSVNASLRDGGVSSGSAVEVLDGAPTVHDIEFLDGRLRGRVIDAASEPVARASIQLALVRSASESMRGATNANVHTDSEGKFELRGLTPGEHRLTISDDGGFGEPRFGALVVDSVVVPAEAARDDLVLRVEPGAGIRCRVRGLDGGAAIGAVVSARSPEGGTAGRTFGDRTSDGAGMCTITGLASGEHIVVARLDDAVGVSGAVRAQSGEPREVEVSLRRGGRLAITRNASEGVSFKGKIAVLDSSGFDWGLGAAQWSVDGAVWNLGPLPAGAYRVRAGGANGEVAEVSATVSAGDTQPVTLQLTAQ